MIIDVSDFNDRPYKVPNQKESVEFKDFIEKAEEDLLISLLGYSLYKEFIAGLATGPVPQKWTDLKDGAEYTYSDKLYKYNGLIDFLKPAIYSLWMSQGQYKFTNVGWTQNLPRKDNNQADVSTNLDALEFQVQYWNTFCSKVGGTCRPYFYHTYHNSFFGFMSVARNTDPETYPDWEFSPPKPINRLSL